MADNIGQIATSLESAQAVLTEYRDIVTDLQEQVSSVRQGLPVGLRWLGIIFTFVLVWLGIAQIGPFDPAQPACRRRNKHDERYQGVRLGAHQA
jgi:hypothetical protein